MLVTNVEEEAEDDEAEVEVEDEGGSMILN